MSFSCNKLPTVAIIGAGPAGLTAAYLLARCGIKVTVFESDPKYVGGISRTAQYKGFQFDIGGHRFFSKSERVEKFWREILPNDLLKRPRSSRIYYRRHFFSYPLRATEALVKLGVVEAIRCCLSYLGAKARPIRPVKSFEDWVVNHFGRRLFDIFFKTYTEKIWGMRCSEISADWAAQRIQGLSLGKAIVHTILPRRFSSAGSNGHTIKTLINSFYYPRRGPGMMWEACANKTRGMGGQILMGCTVNRLDYSSAEHRWRIYYRSAFNCEPISIEVDHVISSAPMRELSGMIQPPLTEAALRAARALKYRDFFTVMVILKDRNRFRDNWIYIHDPTVKVGRVQNFKSWSPEMVPDALYTCYGLEYFCFQSDGLWNSGDDDLLELAKRELVQLGLAKQNDIVDGCVVRQPKAYPVYDEEYSKHVDVIRQEIETNYPGLHLVGRNGMHKYNNQDHAMMTAMLTVENIVAGRKLYDVWAVNQDAEYIEMRVSTERAQPERVILHQ
jgi:protoporphyrinogen oxidase